jgi:hypothetical protein
VGNIKKEAKDPKKDDDTDSTLKDSEPTLDGKRLHDLYRHTTKLIE